MLQRIKAVFSNKLLSNSVIYTLISFINKGFPFFLLPILTRSLSTHDYGEYALFRATTSLLLPFIGFNLSEYVMKNYFTKDEYPLSKKISISLMVNIVVCILVFSIFSLINGDMVYDFVHIHKKYFLIATVITLCTSVNNIERNLLRSENNTKLYSILVIGQTLSFFIGVMALFFLHKIELDLLIYVELSTFLLFVLVSIVLLTKKYRATFYYDKKLLKLAFLFCLPLVTNSLFAYIFSLSDRFIMANELDTKSVGVYNATVQLVSILQILAVSFNTAWTPFVYSKLEQKINPTKLKKVQLAAATTFLLVCIVFYIGLSYSFELIVSKKYAEGIPLLKWLILGNFFQLLYWLNSTILIYHKQNWYLAIFSFSSMVLSLGLNLLFLQKYGIEFASIVFLISWIVIALMTFVKSEMILKKQNLHNNFSGR
ncbi:oligosaccharide flippase family protein [Chryseobacterium sp. SSA4.19]|uniref:lipopolysaccharide biosynthesis protein n=1 Tax=Chryseobacterium sp. SSA4.19 TaxID=2919915 RepID=UPI001F4E31AE|nr:oligosaccharide flippase family protein [Chryseobacterium sp. SSA4.19]MCJ8152363.1 oligosaccharide flippase family protein [Chryseobacterium sp. SSA4.19]